MSNDKISKLVEKIDTLPASPALLPKLAQTLGDVDNTDVHEIVDIIVFDSALTAKLLQIANSAYFGSSVAITNVGEAINQLGYNAVFKLATAISCANFMRTAPGSGLDAVALWKHSVITAFCAQHVAKPANVEDNLAFTTGLLHDLGKVVLAETYGKNYTTMFDPARRGTMSLHEWELHQYGCDHAEVGATLLESWRLPKPLVNGVKYHHHPAAALGNASLAACICLGNVLAQTFENQTFAVDPANPEIVPALKIVNLTPNDLRTQWNSIQEKWEFVETLCGLRV